MKIFVQKHREYLFLTIIKTRIKVNPLFFMVLLNPLFRFFEKVFLNKTDT